MSTKLRKPIDQRSSAVLGFLLALPLGLLWFTIVFKVEFIENIFKTFLTSDGTQPHIFGFAYVIAGLLLLPVAFIITLIPVVKDKKPYILNLVVGVIILYLILQTWGGLLSELYRCDILHIPNCD